MSSAEDDPPSPGTDKLPGEDKPNAIREHSSNRLDNKLSDKSEAELAQIVGAWPTLPEHIKVAIMALIETA